MQVTFSAVATSAAIFTPASGSRVRVVSGWIARTSGSGSGWFEDGGTQKGPKFVTTTFSPMIFPYNGKGWIDGTASAALTFVAGAGTKIEGILEIDVLT